MLVVLLSHCAIALLTSYWVSGQSLVLVGRSNTVLSEAQREDTSTKTATADPSGCELHAKVQSPHNTIDRASRRVALECFQADARPEASVLN